MRIRLMTTEPRLKTILASGEFVVAPGVFDMFSARIADRTGFLALYMTGYGVSGSYLGVADAGLVTYRDMVERARTIAGGTRTPLIADADTGFGGLINVRQTVRGYEAAGVQAVQIEDQEMPKKCGHTPNRRVIDARDMCRKIEVAVDARTRDDTLIIARTDARTGLGLDEAIRRGREYAKAGADIVFVEAPESEDEFRRAGDAIDCWLLANMVPTGKSPVVSAEKLKAFGFNIAIYPSAGMSVVCAALEASYGYLKGHGTS
jgi:2-methylisocitrate lyase-like PEP mutase family enzyme